MSKVSSYKKLYYVGFTFLFIFVSIVIYMLSIVFNQYSLKQKDTSNTIVDTTLNQPDTIFQEKIVEKEKIIDAECKVVPETITILNDAINTGVKK